MQMCPSHQLYADTYMLLWESCGYDCNIEQMRDNGLHAPKFRIETYVKLLYES